MSPRLKLPDRQQSAVESLATQIYGEINHAWIARENTFPTWKLGFRILYSPPLAAPELMIVGENPGCYKEQLYSLEEHSGWPSENEYVSQSWPLARKLQGLFATVGASAALKSSVGLNANFFRSHSSQSKDAGLRWRDNPAGIRSELEAICLSKCFDMAQGMKPRAVLALGMRAFDGLTRARGNTLLTRQGDGARLCAIGDLSGTPVIGVIHPTGAQVATKDWGVIMELVRAQIGL